jgi:hypothetical protein
VLDTPGIGLFTNRMVWRDLDQFSENAVCLVLASEPYDPEEYIRSIDDWRDLLGDIEARGPEEADR